MFIEALRQAINQDNNIRGITMLGQEHKMSLFVDDILIYFYVLSLFFSTLTQICLVPGYKLFSKGPNTNPQLQIYIKIRSHEIHSLNNSGFFLYFFRYAIT